MLIIKSNHFEVTESMKESANEQFSFLNEEALTHLRLKVETLNPHRIRIKAIYQAPKQPTQTIEVLTTDFYKGIEQIAKKFKARLKRQEKKIRQHRHKRALGLALSEIEAMERELAPKILTSLDVPIYCLTTQEAVDQLNAYDYQVLMYHDRETDLLCTLVRQSDQSIKQYIGIE